MKVNAKQQAELTNLIAERAEAIAASIVIAVNANAQHVRGAATTFAIKVGRNVDDPTLIEVTSQLKQKVPKSKFSDITSWDETELLMSFDSGEEPGQQRIDD